MSLFHELKRRNVIRVSMAYLAGAWLLVQVADTVIPWLGLNVAVGRILLIAMIVGFIPVVIATWLFEWTPDGIRFDDEVEVDAVGAVVSRRRLDRIIIGVLALAVVYFAVDEFLFDTKESGSSYGDRSIAVLPLRDISPDGDQSYLADGIADALRLELQQLKGLRVAGQMSSTQYAKEGIETIGEMLDVESILEGSIRQDGNRVRISVQLTRVADGIVIWTDRYDRKLERIFEMEAEIATSVAGELGVRLGVGDVNAFRGAGTRNVEAYEAYLRAQNNAFTPAATPLLERAIELDPNYAVARSMLASEAIHWVWWARADEVPKLMERAHELALQGVRLDSESAYAHAVLGIVLMFRSDWIGAEQALARANVLLADRPTSNRYAVMLMRSGRLTASQQHFEIATTLEPLGGRPASLSWHASLAQGRIAEAKERRYWDPGPDLFEDELDIAFNMQDPEALKAAIQGLPGNNLSLNHLYGPLLAEFDSIERVSSILQRVYKDETLHWPRKLHDIAMAAAYFGDPQFALKVKRDDILRNPTRIGAIWYPVMSDVRRLPEFKELVTELNMVEYWREFGWADACAPSGNDDFKCT